MLSAVTSDLIGADRPGGFSYWWLRGGRDIEGATSRTHKLTPADADNATSVEVSCADGHGNAESVTSAESAAVRDGGAVQIGTEECERLRGVCGTECLDENDGDDALVRFGGTEILVRDVTVETLQDADLFQLGWCPTAPGGQTVPRAQGRAKGRFGVKMTCLSSLAAVAGVLVAAADVHSADRQLVSWTRRRWFARASDSRTCNQSASLSSDAGAPPANTDQRLRILYFSSKPMISFLARSLCSRWIRRASTASPPRMALRTAR
ncbi:hypothetical protein SAMN05421757_110102 [Tropicimonas sediminicola]|uniref:Uncharacterized protein n=1 Tax=Tropicimonas sediminicola TaxID=1031541 RepID=A0A239LP13_9RHOB|nr:hypothetical protein SAMN05421757_110102 [Tropicimonas sediminicola]